MQVSPVSPAARFAANGELRQRLPSVGHKVGQALVLATPNDTFAQACLAPMRLLGSSISLCYLLNISTHKSVFLCSLWQHKGDFCAACPCKWIRKCPRRNTVVLKLTHARKKKRFTVLESVPQGVPADSQPVCFVPAPIFFVQFTSKMAFLQA